MMMHKRTERATSRHPDAKVAVVIPCYPLRRHILEVLANIPISCQAIYVIDDACPDHTGDFVESSISDPRVHVIRHAQNMGVGGATLTGMERAFGDGAAIVVKLDGDGQMDPTLLARFATPLLRGEADYAKGNRFFALEDLAGMPRVRLWGNAALSFISKLSSGYWSIFDPTNGYIAIHRTTFQCLPIGRVDKRFFFESDMLFHLNLLRAVVIDIPIRAIYGDEVSNLSIASNVGRFVHKHIRNCASRLFYTYVLRDFSIASIYLILSPPLLLFGFIFGLERWLHLAYKGVEATAGTVMLASLPIILGAQMMLAFVSLDIGNVPRHPLQSLLSDDDP